MNSLPILYTYALRGDLASLPRLYTALHQMSARLEAEHGVRPLLLDLGQACAPEVWHCARTDGRSVLIVLDGMGYHAAHVSGMTAANRLRLQGMTRMALVDAQHAWRYDVPPIRDEGIVITSSPAPALRLNIILTPAEQTTLAQRTLHLAAIPGTLIGSALVKLHPEPQLLAAQQHPLPPGARPAATIAAAVELVEDEARSLS